MIFETLYIVVILSHLYTDDSIQLSIVWYLEDLLNSLNHEDSDNNPFCHYCKQSKMGRSWGEVSNISTYLGGSRGLLPGPGTGPYIEQEDRIVMACHYLTAERNNDQVVIYYSDDGGLTWDLSPSGRFPGQTRPWWPTWGATTSLSTSGEMSQNVRCVLIRSVPTVSCQGLDSWYCQAGACYCRGRAFSNDNGVTWTEMELGGCSWKHIYISLSYLLQILSCEIPSV